MHLPTVVFLAPAAVCVLSWLGAGLAVPRRLLPGDALLDWLTRIGVGAVAVSLALFALGRAGAFERWLVVALTVLGAAVGCVALPRLVRDVRVPGGRVADVLLGVVAVALVLDLVAASAPPTSADALKYHLALPKLWLQLGSVGDPFWRWEGFGPSTVDLLYGQGLALGGGATAAALGAAFAVLCALAVFGLGRDLAGSALAGAAAAFLFVLQGIVTWEATSAFVELGLTFFSVMAAWHALRWARTPSRSGAGWVGAFAGAAAGTKYLGLVTAAIVLGLVGVIALMRRRLPDLAVAAGAGIAAGGAWYLRNAIETGNPLYPLVFGGKWVTPFLDGRIDAIADQYGLSSGVWRLPLLPLDLVVHGSAFDRGRYVGTAIFVLAALALVTARTREVLVLLGGALVYLVAWWEQTPQARFLLPALAVLAAVGGTAVAPWLRSGGARRAAAIVVIACAAAAWLASSVALTRQLLPPTVGAESRSAFLERLTGTYVALRAARERAGSGTFGVVGYDSVFNLPGRAIQIDAPEFDPSLDRREYLARLRSEGVTNLLVGNDPGQYPQLDPIRSCLRPIATYHARFVTSRSLGESVPYDLVLVSLAGCAE
jgi:hypothetical protein